MRSKNRNVIFLQEQKDEFSIAKRGKLHGITTTNDTDFNSYSHHPNTVSTYCILIVFILVARKRKEPQFDTKPSKPFKIVIVMLKKTLKPNISIGPNTSHFGYRPFGFFLTKECFE